MHASPCPILRYWKVFNLSQWTWIHISSWLVCYWPKCNWGPQKFREGGSRANFMLNSNLYFRGHIKVIYVCREAKTYSYISTDFYGSRRETIKAYWTVKIVLIPYFRFAFEWYGRCAWVLPRCDYAQLYKGNIQLELPNPEQKVEIGK